MSELGQYLKEVREEKQISLESLQATTKIQKRYLIAIEEGRFDTLPGIFYARAFVKTYAETIGLDADDVLERYKNELPNPQSESANLPSRSERVKQSPQKIRKEKSSIIPALIGIVILVIIVVVIWMIAQKGNEPQENVVSPGEEENIEADIPEDIETDQGEEEPPVINEDDDEEDADLDEVENEEDNDSELAFVNSEGNTSYFNLENVRLTDVRVVFSGDSYFDVKNGSGDMLYSGSQKEGDELLLEELEGEEEVLFNFGASQNATLFIDGKEVDFPIEDMIHQKIMITVIE